MQPNIITLKEVLKHKLKIFKQLKAYIKPVEELAKDAGLAHTDESEHLILEKHLFGEDTGILPLIDELIELNNLILTYEIPLYLGDLAISHYNAMTAKVEEEQEFLKDLLRPTLAEVKDNKPLYKEHWTSSMGGYENLLHIVMEDLIHFDRTLQTTSKTAINWIINLIYRLNIDEAAAFLDNDNSKILRDKDINFFRRLLMAIKEGRIEDVHSILEEGKEILDDEEYGLLKKVILSRESLEKATKDLGKARMSRRRFLKLGMAAAATTATAGGLAYILSRKPEEAKIPVNSRRANIELPFVEPNFGIVTIPEVNKTVYTEGKYRNAKYIVIIPHSTELNALDAARSAAKGPITYVAGNHDRNLKIKTKKELFEIDPNNAFCQQGIEYCFKRLYEKEWGSLNPEIQNYIATSVKKFVDEVSRRIFVNNKMILGLHQNTKNAFGIKSYRDEPRFSKFAAEVNINPNESKDVFAYVNTRGWFEVLKAVGWNVTLQKNENNVDDGSISYAATWKNLPYVNIEVLLGDAGKQAQMITTLNELIEKYPELATDMNYISNIKGVIQITQEK